jgi:hypothetical protein
LRDSLSIFLIIFHTFIMVYCIIKSRSESFCAKPRDWRPRRSRGQSGRKIQWLPNFLEKLLGTFSRKISTFYKALLAQSLPIVEFYHWLKYLYNFQSHPVFVLSHSSLVNKQKWKILLSGFNLNCKLSFFI